MQTYCPTSSSQFLQNLINAIADPLLVKDRQHRWVLFNDAFCEFVGQQPAGLLNRTDADFLSAEQVETFWQKDEQVFITGITAEAEEQFETIEGLKFEISVKKSLLQADSGELFLVCITRDIRRYKQIESELRESQQRLQQQLAAFEATDDGIAVLQNDRFIQMNQAHAEIYGYAAPEAMIGQNWRMLYAEPELQEFEQTIIPLLLKRGRWQGETIAKRHDGSCFHQEVRLTLAPDQSLICLCRDITARKQAELKLRESETQLRRANEVLEQRVTDRTAQLTQIVAQLEQEVSERQQAELRLRESQQLLQLVMDNIPQLIFWKDQNSVYQGCNQNGARVAGVESPDELIGWTDYDMPWTTEQANWYRECDRRVMETGIPDLHIIEPQQQAGSKQAWLDTNKIPLRDEQGNPMGILVTIEDITERKATEQAMIESEARFRSIVENAHDMIVMLTPEGVVSYTSPHWLEMFGYSPQETLSHHFARFIHPDYLPLCTEAFTQVATGISDALVIEYRAIHQDGSYRWHTTNLSAIKDAAGQVQHCIAIVRDITDRRQAEEILHRKEQFLRSIYHGVDHPIFVIDVSGQTFRYIDWNRAAEKAFGITAADVIGKTPEQIYGAGTGQIEQQRWLDCFTTGLPLTYEEWLVLDNQITWWMTTLNPLRNEQGEIYQIVGTTFDITERKTAEAQLQQQASDLQLALQELQQTQMQMIQSEKMSSLGQLVAGVAHEINNPVNFIYGNLSHATTYTQDLLELVQIYQTHYPNPVVEVAAAVEAIELEFLVEDLPKLLSSMRIGAERIQAIVASLRTFSRMDEAEMKAISVHEGIDSTLMILQSRLKAQGSQPPIALIKQYGDLPPVECYAGQLNQVFMNILTNAIDALEERAEQEAKFMPQITIRTTRLGANQVCVQIADNGGGMSERVQQRLFDPFFTTKPVGKGTGMGLSISYQIITEKHGGSLRCVSTPGQGTVFSVIVPIEQAVS